MSFQGDVAGLGLGELLQGLARGGREGVLTLYGGGLSTTLGVLSGQIHLLPEPDEDPEIWRKRCGSDWPDDDNKRVASMRRIDIAYAALVDRMFDLLDCEGVHFRFQPGPLPCANPLSTEPAAGLPQARPTQIEATAPVFCQPVSVEFLLLEHARLADERSTHGHSKSLPVHELPGPLLDVCALPGAQLLPGGEGASNVCQISGPRAWTLRPTEAWTVATNASGHLRPTSANQPAPLTRAELSRHRFLRAALRPSGWA